MFIYMSTRRTHQRVRYRRKKKRKKKRVREGTEDETVFLLFFFFFGGDVSRSGSFFFSFVSSTTLAKIMSLLHDYIYARIVHIQEMIWANSTKKKEKYNFLWYSKLVLHEGMKNIYIYGHRYMYREKEDI